MEEDLFLVEMKMSGRCGHRNWWYAGTQDVALRTPAADILCITHTKALLEDQTREDINCTHTLHSKFI